MAQDDLTGHFIGGLICVCIGLWWLYSALKQYYLANLLQKRNFKYRNLASYPCPCAPNWPIEGWFKTFISAVGMLNELNWGDPNNNVVTGKHAQHSMLWAFYGFSGVADLLTHHYPRMVPQHLDSIALSLAFFMKYWIFANHTHGKDMLENTIHGFLLPLDLGSAAATLVAVVWKDSVVPAFLRSAFLITSGTWVANVGWILYPPSGTMTWDPNDADHLMLVGGLFTLHFAFSLFFSLVFLTMVYARFRRLTVGLPLSTYHSYIEKIDGKKIEGERDTKMVSY